MAIMEKKVSITVIIDYGMSKINFYDAYTKKSFNMIHK